MNSLECNKTHNLNKLSPLIKTIYEQGCYPKSVRTWEFLNLQQISLIYQIADRNRKAMQGYFLIIDAVQAKESFKTQKAQISHLFGSKKLIKGNIHLLYLSRNLKAVTKASIDLVHYFKWAKRFLLQVRFQKLASVGKLTAHPNFRSKMKRFRGTKISQCLPLRKKKEIAPTFI